MYTVRPRRSESAASTALNSMANGSSSVASESSASALMAVRYVSRAPSSVTKTGASSVSPEMPV